MILDFQKKDWQFRDLITEDELNRMEDGIEEGITKAEQAQQTATDAQTNLDNHVSATTGVHGATSTATPNTIVQRDPAGRFKAAAPSASDDVARKAEVDEKVSKSGDTMTGPLDVRSEGNPAVIVRRENREDWIALTPPFGNPYSSKIVIKSESIGQDPTEYEMIRFNSYPGSVGKQISLLTSNVERVRVEDSITTILNGLQVTGQIYRGTGSPEGSVSAPVGSIYHRADGGAGTALYVKEAGSGNTGWVAIGQSILTETGTFSPVLAGVVTPGNNTYSTQIGRYAKVGRLVHFFLQLALAAKDPNMSGAVVISGLPFPVDGISAQSSAAIAIYRFVDRTPDHELGGRIEASGRISLWENGVNIGPKSLGASQITDTSEFTISGVYLTNM